MTMDILSESIVIKFGRVQKKLSAFYDRAFDPFHLTLAQFLLLVVLFERNGRTVKEFGETLGLKGGAITPLLDQLERKGYIERRSDQFDRRAVQIMLTEQGRLSEQALRDLFEETNDKISRLLQAKFRKEDVELLAQMVGYVDFSL